MSEYLLECCVYSVESAMAAAEGGADRLELCAALIIGGISPSLALFKQVKECCALPVRALLRPRFGDFLYTDYEFRIIRREVELFREAGAEGVVIGCLAEDGSLNRERMKELLALPEYVFPAALLVIGRPTRQQRERPKPERFERRFMVRENRYRSLTGEELRYLENLVQGRTYTFGFALYGGRQTMEAYTSGIRFQLRDLPGDWYDDVEFTIIEL